MTLDDVRDVYEHDELRLIFLDYDGVINTPCYEINGVRKTVPYTLPLDFERLYNCYAISLLNQFALKNNAKIVVTSSWNCNPKYMEMLYKSGLDERIEVLGKTNDIGRRYRDIIDYLVHHPHFHNFVIFDDMTDFDHLKKWLCHCDPEVGITKEVIKKAQRLIDKKFK